MKPKSDRRSFIKKLSIGSMTATVVPGAFLEADAKSTSHQKEKVNRLPETNRTYNSSYTGDYLKRVAFPIGGLGAGMFCLEGTGAISHMSVHHKPEIFHEPGMFAALSVKGLKNGTKVIEGPSPDWKKFGQPDSGNGSGGTIFGLPRFRNAEFLARFPFGFISLEDDDLPVKVSIEGWSPFIPTDADNSSLPVGALEYKFVNTGTNPIEAVFSFNSRNFMRKEKAKGAINKIMNGFVLSCEDIPEKPNIRGDFAIFTDQSETVVDHCWFRGGWFDPLTITWETIRKGEMKSVEPVESGAPGASLYVPLKLSAGEEKKIRLMMAWYVPGSDLRIGDDVPANEKCDPATGCCTTTYDLGVNGEKPFTGTSYKPWYSNKFWDVKVADYFKKNYDDLKKWTYAKSSSS